MKPISCDFRAYEVCTNLRRGLLQRSRRPCSDFMDMLRRLISYRIIIIIIIIIRCDEPELSR